MLFSTDALIVLKHIKVSDGEWVTAAAALHIKSKAKSRRKEKKTAILPCLERMNQLLGTPKRKRLGGGETVSWSK